jgi:hypothetical protein
MPRPQQSIVFFEDVTNILMERKMPISTCLLRCWEEERVALQRA